MEQNITYQQSFSWYQLTPQIVCGWCWVTQCPSSTQWSPPRCLPRTRCWLSSRSRRCTGPSRPHQSASLPASHWCRRGGCSPCRSESGEPLDRIWEIVRIGREHDDCLGLALVGGEPSGDGRGGGVVIQCGPRICSHVLKNFLIP